MGCFKSATPSVILVLVAVLKLLHNKSKVSLMGSKETYGRKPVVGGTSVRLPVPVALTVSSSRSTVEQRMSAVKIMIMLYKICRN